MQLRTPPLTPGPPGPGTAHLWVSSALLGVPSALFVGAPSVIFRPEGHLAELLLFPHATTPTPFAPPGQHSSPSSGAEPLCSLKPLMALRCKEAGLPRKPRQSATNLTDHKQSRTHSLLQRHRPKLIVSTQDSFRHRSTAHSMRASGNAKARRAVRARNTLWPPAISSLDQPQVACEIGTGASAAPLQERNNLPLLKHGRHLDSQPPLPPAPPSPPGNPQNCDLTWSPFI
jgi:hypothetical protein